MRYEYKCVTCSNIWEEHHSMSVDDGVKELGLECTNCHSQNIHKYLGNIKTATVRFVGTGFYVNEQALKAAGMPESTMNSPMTKQRLKRIGRD